MCHAATARPRDRPTTAARTVSTLLAGMPHLYDGGMLANKLGTPALGAEPS